MTSVNTNYGALVALQSLRGTNEQLDQVQNRINTGLKVATAKDNGAVYAIAQDQRARLGAQSVIRDAIDRVSATIDVGLSAAESVQNVLLQMKDKALAASAQGLAQGQIDAYNSDFVALRDSISPLVGAAQLNGQNLINSTATLQVKVNDLNLGTVITITGQDLTATGLGVSTLSFGSFSDASAAVATISGAISTINTSVALLGSKAKALETTKGFISKLSDSVEKGLGVLVDADLGRESARLQSLQIKQQLGAQALSIANQGPQIVLSLFR
jgi:flagellin